MLARVAGEFYWMGRYLERTEHTARLLQHQLVRLVDSPADELAAGWEAAYRVLRQPVPEVSEDAEEAEVFLIADAYTLAGILVESKASPDSVRSCWAAARENAKQVRPLLPLRVWTCLNQGFLGLRDSNFAEMWALGPAVLVTEVIEQMRLFAGVVEARMPRDDAWRFLELGRFVERVQHQTVLLDAWNASWHSGRGGRSLAWSDLLRVCGAYELYCRTHSMAVQRESVLDLLIRNPELPRSLRFGVQRIGDLLAGIDPKGARYPLALPHRAALRLAAAVEIEKPDDAEDPGGGGFFPAIERDSHAIHDLITAGYVEYPVDREPAP